MCRKLLVGILVGYCRCAMSYCDLNLTYDLTAVALNFKVLSAIP